MINTQTKPVTLQKGDQFKIHHGHHFGRTYRVESFGTDKFGVKYAACVWTDKPGDCEIFSEQDLNQYGSLFRMWDTTKRENDEQYFERLTAA